MEILHVWKHIHVHPKAAIHKLYYIQFLIVNGLFFYCITLRNFNLN